MNMRTFDWAVIGAGPAGIAAVGKLIDHGVDDGAILWIDPEFKVGDFGTKWRHVSSNTKVKLFNKFYQTCQAFKYQPAQKQFEITHLDPETHCVLGVAAEPLQWITEHLRSRVYALAEKALELKLEDRHWNIQLNTKKLRAKNVILATGAEPVSFGYHDVEEIPLEKALDPKKLKASCKKDDRVAVFGSSHSAILIIKTLVEQCDVKKIINFYLQPLRFAVEFDDWILFDDTGLKGQTAFWARKHINGELPKNLERVISEEETIRMILPQCSKAIYATGFQKRLVPVDGMKSLDYNNNNGIIAPGLFGFGIAFPEAKLDRFGTLEYRVGLWKFIEYINLVMPVWLKYGV